MERRKKEVKKEIHDWECQFQSQHPQGQKPSSEDKKNAPDSIRALYSEYKELKKESEDRRSHHHRHGRSHSRSTDRRDRSRQNERRKRSRSREQERHPSQDAAKGDPVSTDSLLALVTGVVVPNIAPPEVDGLFALVTSAVVPDIAPPAASTHPCLRYGQCRHGDQCRWSNFPYDSCVHHLWPRKQCTGHCGLQHVDPNDPRYAKPFHPCVRVYGHCMQGDSCMWANFPSDACLDHLKPTRTCAVVNCPLQHLNASDPRYCLTGEHFSKDGRKHPCLRKGTCRDGDQCRWVNFPLGACLDHLRGKCQAGRDCTFQHVDALDPQHCKQHAATHPCLRIYPTCVRGEQCCWVHFPFDACFDYLNRKCADDNCPRKHVDPLDPRYRVLGEELSKDGRTHPCRRYGRACPNEGRHCPWEYFPLGACLDHLRPSRTCTERNCPWQHLDPLDPRYCVTGEQLSSGGKKHPCLRGGFVCRDGDKCPWVNFPFGACLDHLRPGMTCEAGERCRLQHIEPSDRRYCLASHPCLRVYGKCPPSNNCSWVNFPSDTCLDHLKGKCPGINCRWKHLDRHDPRYCVTGEQWSSGGQKHPCLRKGKCLNGDGCLLVNFPKGACLDQLSRSKKCNDVHCPLQHIDRSDPRYCITQDTNCPYRHVV